MAQYQPYYQVSQGRRGVNALSNFWGQYLQEREKLAQMQFAENDPRRLDREIAKSQETLQRLVAAQSAMQSAETRRQADLSRGELALLRELVGGAQERHVEMGKLKTELEKTSWELGARNKAARQLDSKTHRKIAGIFDNYDLQQLPGNVEELDTRLSEVRKSELGRLVDSPRKQVEAAAKADSLYYHTYLEAKAFADSEVPEGSDNPKKAREARAQAGALAEQIRLQRLDGTADPDVWIEQRHPTDPGTIYSKATGYQIGQVIPDQRLRELLDAAFPSAGGPGAAPPSPTGTAPSAVAPGAGAPAPGVERLKQLIEREVTRQEQLMDERETANRFKGYEANYLLETPFKRYEEAAAKAERDRPRGYQGRRPDVIIDGYRRLLGNLSQKDRRAFLAKLPVELRNQIEGADDVREVPRAVDVDRLTRDLRGTWPESQDAYERRVEGLLGGVPTGDPTLAEAWASQVGAGFEPEIPEVRDVPFTGGREYGHTAWGDLTPEEVQAAQAVYNMEVRAALERGEQERRAEARRAAERRALLGGEPVFTPGGGAVVAPWPEDAPAADPREVMLDKAKALGRHEAYIEPTLQHPDDELLMQAMEPYFREWAEKGEELPAGPSFRLY